MSDPADWAKISHRDLVEMDKGRLTKVGQNLAIWIEINEQHGRRVTTRADEASQHVIYEAWDPSEPATSLLPDH